MKFILPLLFATFTAASQDMSDPIRFFNGRPVTLKPLFTWWTNAEGLNASNLKRQKKDQIEIPPRVMPAWVRITTSAITNISGAQWIADANIQISPGGPKTNMLISLRHGPFVEIAQLQTAVQQFRDAGMGQEAANNAFAFQQSRSRSLTSSGNFWYEVGNAAGVQGYRNTGDDYYNASKRADRAADSAFNRSTTLGQQRSQLYQITRGRSVFTLDTFALRTGQVYAGLPVYDLGLPPRH